MAPPSARLPVFASDDWMLEQQIRAEVEAEGWRRLREELAPAAIPPPAPAPEKARRNLNLGAGILLKGLVRFALGAFGGYLAFVAAMDSGAGEFEAWLAVLAGFVITLCLTLFSPGRRLVALLAEATRWALMIGAGLGAVWLLGHMSA